LKALNHGKHVLLEKPVALCIDDYNDMIQAAHRNNKFLMDGTMFPHHIRTSQCLEAISDVDLMGMITRIQISFSFLGNEKFFARDIRVSKDGDPLGCIGDLGWYCVRLAILVFDAVGSDKVTSAQVEHCRLTPDGVPIDATCLVEFEQVNRDDSILHLTLFAQDPFDVNLFLKISR
jgi:predicted dehydrogenase